MWKQSIGDTIDAANHIGVPESKQSTNIMTK